MGHIGTRERREHLVRKVEISDVAPLATEQSRVLGTQDSGTQYRTRAAHAGPLVDMKRSACEGIEPAS